MPRPVLAQLAALAAALLVLVAASALWAVNLAAGPPMDGFSGGAKLVFVPMALLVLTLFWLLVRSMFGNVVRWGALTALGGALALSVLVIVFYCGPVACFLPGSERLMGWFVVLGTGAAAVVHHLVLGRFLSHGASHVSPS